jgi:hypothetical protein
MHTVDDDAQDRRAHRDGMAIRQIARTFRVSRRTVREALASPVPRPYTRTKPPLTPVLGPFTAIIDQILAADRTSPPKQRHTAKRIYERLRAEHGFTGGYTIVKAYVRERRARAREMFVPLAHPLTQPFVLPVGHRLADERAMTLTEQLRGRCIGEGDGPCLVDDQHGVSQDLGGDVRIDSGRDQLLTQDQDGGIDDEHGDWDESGRVDRKSPGREVVNARQEGDRKGCSE